MPMMSWQLATFLKLDANCQYRVSIVTQKVTVFNLISITMDKKTIVRVILETIKYLAGAILGYLGATNGLV